MSNSNSNYHKKENRNIKGLFSALCLCIIALALIVYFSTMNDNAKKNNAVNENRTLEVTTEVQRAVTYKETTTKQAQPTTEKTTQAKQTTEQTTTEKVTMSQGENNTPYKSFYKYPLTEAVVKGYTEELVFDSTMGDYRSHAAVDFKGKKGDEVVAINDGIVTDVYNDSMLGQVVEIDHGGKLVARYCGLESVAVKKGSLVDIGNKLGTLGRVPQEAKDEAHLHFETRLDGKLVNPLDVMGKTE